MAPKDIRSCFGGVPAKKSDAKPSGGDAVKRPAAQQSKPSPAKKQKTNEGSAAPSAKRPALSPVAQPTAGKGKGAASSGAKATPKSAADGTKAAAKQKKKTVVDSDWDSDFKVAEDEAVDMITSSDEEELPAQPTKRRAVVVSSDDEDAIEDEVMPTPKQRKDAAPALGQGRAMPASLLCLPWIMHKVKLLSSGHPVAEVFLIGWAFVYLIEGASGFGTPVALAAPLLVSLGHPAVPAVACCLITNTLATVYGAVGTPVWFGLDGLGLSDDDLKDVGFKAEVMLCACAHVVPLIAASFLVPWRKLLKSWLFVLLSIWSAALPALGISLVSLEFPSLGGGAAALLVTGVMSATRFGLSKEPGKHSKELGSADSAVRTSHEPGSGRELPSTLPAANTGERYSASNAMYDVDGDAGDEEVHLPYDAAKDPERHRSLRGRAVSEGREDEQPGASPKLDDIYRDYVPNRFDESAARTNKRAPKVPRQLTPSTRPPSGSQRQRISSVTSQESEGSQMLRLYPSAGPLPRPKSSRERMNEEAGALAYASDPRRWHRSLSGRLSSRSSRRPSYVVGKGSMASMAEVDAPADLHSEEGSVSGYLVDEADLAIKPGMAGVVQALLRTMPLWLTVVLLLLTRIDPITLRERFQRSEPNVTAYLGNLFTLEISAWLRFSVRDIFGTTSPSLVWSYAFLYVPFFIPFIVVSIITVIIYRKHLPEGHSMLSPFAEAFRRAGAIAPALLGSLALVALIRKGDPQTASPAYIIGYNLADFMGSGFIAITAALGALGSFFSGSTTVSNLTFGVVQKVAAQSIDVNVTAMLALQALGATAGNMICINNIISARAVVGGDAAATSEGTFISKTAPALAVMLIIGTGVALPFLLL